MIIRIPKPFRFGDLLLQGDCERIRQRYESIFSAFAIVHKDLPLSVHPVTGTPQGGIVSPILANVYLHYALDLWFDRVVKPRCGGQAILIRYADDFVCAFQYLHDAERFYRVLPKRLQKFGLQVAPEKTRILRFSRFHPGLPRRFAFLGFELYWKPDWRGELRVMKRTARKKLQSAKRRMKAGSEPTVTCEVASSCWH